MFNEHASWSWRELVQGEKRQVFSVFDDPPEEAPEEEKQVQDAGSSAIVTPNPPSSNEVEDSPTPTRYKSLKEIYDTCSFVLNMVDPENYKDAAKEVEWREAMQVEMDAIQ